MVEFGLKLEDNKVSEWADRYIDYETLKKILKKAKNAETKKKELVEKNPALAERIIQAHNNGEIHYITSVSSMDDFSRTSSMGGGGGGRRDSSRGVGGGVGSTVVVDNSRHQDRFSSSGNLIPNLSTISLPTLYSERTKSETDTTKEPMTTTTTEADGRPPKQNQSSMKSPTPPTTIREGSDQSSIIFTTTKEESGRSSNYSATGRLSTDGSFDDRQLPPRQEGNTSSIDPSSIPTESSPLLLNKNNSVANGNNNNNEPPSTPSRSPFGGGGPGGGEIDDDNDNWKSSRDSRMSLTPDDLGKSVRSTASSDSEKRRSSFHQTFSNLSGHLSAFVTAHGNSGSRYERNLRAALDDIDEQTRLFDEQFRSEQKKVVDFYTEQLQELGERLEFVTETVAASFGTNSSRHGNEKRDGVVGGGGGGNGDVKSDFDYDTQLALATRGMNKKTVSPFPVHRKQPSSMGQRVEAMIHRLARNTSTGSNNGSVGHRRRVTHVHLGSLLQGDEEEFDLNYDDEDDDDKHHSLRNKMNKEEYQKRVAEAESIKRSLVSQYRIAKLLHNYAMINITGFVKIAKKFDKTVPEEKGRFKKCLESQNMLNDGKAVEMLTAKYETYYANWFCEGDLRAAKAQMLEKRGDGLEMDWSQLQLGYRMGMCAILALWVCWDCVWGLVADGNSTIGARAAFPVFRACGGLLLLQWFWGVSVFVWTRYRVNYIFLFDLVPRTVSTPFDLFTQAVDNTIPFLTLMLLYYKSGVHNMPQLIPAGGYPLILVLLTVTKLIFPLRQRMPMWDAIFKVITAPAHSPNFFQTYIGDIFTSMVKIFQDIAWTLCWTLSGDFLASEDSKMAFRHDWSKSTWYAKVLIPVLTQLPLVIRFNQCLRKYSDTGDRFPHLANAFKYALSQLVTLFGTFHPLYLEFNAEGSGLPFYQIFWTILFVSSSLYSFVWDVYMDWGLGRPKYGFLGPSLMYPHKYYYYCTIAIDLVLRFMWVLTLVPPTSGASFAVPDYLNALTMMLELFRRTVWGFFRLENEHRSNVSGYRRIGFVPLHFNTGHKHDYEDKKEKRGAFVLREVALVAIAVGALCFGSIAAAQHANQHTTNLQLVKEL